MSLQKKTVFHVVPYKKKTMRAHFESPKAVSTLVTQVSESKKPSQLSRLQISALVEKRSKDKSELFKNNVVSSAITYDSKIQQEKELERQGKAEIERAKFSHRPQTNESWKSFIDMRKSNSVGQFTMNRLRKMHDKYAEIQVKNLIDYKTIEQKEFAGPISMKKIQSMSAMH